MPGRGHPVVAVAAGMDTVGQVGDGDGGVHVDQVHAPARGGPAPDDAGDRGVVGGGPGLQHGVGQRDDRGDEQLGLRGGRGDAVDESGEPGGRVGRVAVLDHVVGPYVQQHRARGRRADPPGDARVDLVDPPPRVALVVMIGQLGGPVVARAHEVDEVAGVGQRPPQGDAVPAGEGEAVGDGVAQRHDPRAAVGLRGGRDGTGEDGGGAECHREQRGRRPPEPSDHHGLRRGWGESPPGAPAAPTVPPEILRCRAPARSGSQGVRRA